VYLKNIEGQLHRDMNRGTQMSKASLFLGVLFFVGSGIQSSFAETHVVDVYDVNNVVSPISAFKEVDLGAEIIGITDVSIRAFGVGGGGNFECAGVTPDGWYDLDVRLGFDNKWWVFSTTNQAEFDVIASEFPYHLEVWPSCEGSPQCYLLITSFAQGTQYTECEAIDYVLPVISHVEITITAESVVSETNVSWGSIKAKYSGVN
jgi:hypothetical protein